MTKSVLVIIWALLFSGFAFAEEKYEFETAQQRADFLALNKELRCPKCQNQNIADSNALIANDMKRKVHQLLLEGNSKEQVIDYMKVRYGEFVHYKPALTPVTFWLYFAPVLFVSLCFFGFLYHRRSSGDEQDAKVEKEPSAVSQQEKLARAESALKELQ